MKQGNWVPLSKALVKKLPTTREYSEVEAMFSISVDYDCDNKVSVSGYSSLWGWSRKKVRNFMKRYGINIIYADKFNPHKKGQVGLQVGDRLGTGKGQVEFINSKCLKIEKDRLGTGKGQVGDRLGTSTNDPNPNPDPKEETYKQPKFDPHSVKPEQVDKKLWSEFLGNRRHKKLQNTELALTTIMNSFSKGLEQGYTYEQMLLRYIESGMQRFKVEWMKEQGKNNGNGFIEPQKDKNYREGL